MKLYRTKRGAVAALNNQYFLLPGNWVDILNRKGLHAKLMSEIATLAPSIEAISFIQDELLQPVDNQEIWAAGVTYYRSKEARMDESKKSGASVFYDKVYDADRPELFFKATPHRVVGHNGTVRIRNDSTWNVPEPELTLFICSEGTIEAYTIGNDMSSRSIEGENPLYLPQAKTYDGSTSIGPCLYIPKESISLDTGIHLSILRQGQAIFNGHATLSQMKRTLPELAGWLTRELTFPAGVFLMTGTCLVPGDGFTLLSEDIIHISIDNIGTLTNTVS